MNLMMKHFYYLKKIQTYIWYSSQTKYPLIVMLFVLLVLISCRWTTGVGFGNLPKITTQTVSIVLDFTLFKRKISDYFELLRYTKLERSRILFVVF